MLEISIASFALHSGGPAPQRESGKRILELIEPYRTPFDLEADLRRARSSFNCPPRSSLEWASWPIYADVVASSVGFGVEHDVLYLIGLGYRELLGFLDLVGFHAGMQLNLRSHADDVDHLAFDVSVAYRAGAGPMEILSASIFGVM